MRKLLTDILKRKDVQKKRTVSNRSRSPPVRPPQTPEYSEGISDDKLTEITRGLKPAIKIVGCGGAGCNTINRCNEEISNVEMYALNTDAAHLYKINAPNKVLIGENITRGLGAGAKPSIGERAVQEVEGKVNEILTGAKMVFITCGMGGGTGTGAAPFVAKMSRDNGRAMTLAIVTFPFEAEGQMRKRNAIWGIDKIKEVANTVIVIKNDKLLELVPRLPLDSAFRVADEILMRSIKSLTKIITETGLINLDYNDVRKIIVDNGGLAMIGMGKSNGEDRIVKAVDEAINSPLLDMDISDATSALVNIVGSDDLTIEEANRAGALVLEKISPSAELILGARNDPDMDRDSGVEVMIVLTGVVSKDVGVSSKDGAYGSSGLAFIE